MHFTYLTGYNLTVLNKTKSPISLPQQTCAAVIVAVFKQALNRQQQFFNTTPNFKLQHTTEIRIYNLVIEACTGTKTSSY